MVSMNTLTKKKARKKITEKMVCGHLEKDPIFGRISTLRPSFRLFHIIKIDNSKKFSRYGLYKYIGEEKRVKKKFTEKMACHQNIPPRRNFSNFKLALTRKLRHLE